MCERSSNSIFAPLTALRIYLSLVISFHLLKQEAIFRALKFSYDAFNDFLILNTCVSNVVSVGPCSFGFDATNCSVLASLIWMPLVVLVPLPSSWIFLACP